MKTTNKPARLFLKLSLLVSLSITAQEPASTTPTKKVAVEDLNSYRYYSNNAIGMRFGLTTGITYKHWFNNGHAFEGILSTYPYNIGLTGLYEKHMDTELAGLQCYIGAGAHINAGRSQRIYYVYDDRIYAREYRSDETSIGVDGIFGIEYKFRPFPLIISADLKPLTEVSNYNNVRIALDPGIGLKIAF